jgi:hypothetical protein
MPPGHGGSAPDGPSGNDSVRLCATVRTTIMDLDP